MENFFSDAGMVTITLVVLYCLKKLYDYYYLKQSTFHENEKVYEAANAFAHGESFEDIESILANCIDFDKQDAEAIIHDSFSHKADADGGYRAFLRSVNKILDADVYDEKRHLQ